MPSGTVKTWNEDKGFGFIEPEDNSEDVRRSKGPDTSHQDADTLCPAWYFQTRFRFVVQFL